ncbi:hypothetical protein DPMN_005258 [Dreissena polymorpha]|uniref:Uncharacterized protein n=1 Tax=Dreissena polymorpha TaxID=45954 RepID=A0A9D4MRU8_DREPO|nr:hypothetical protein DPMN_005258 [Dreissena polymorpha]
MEEHVRLLLLMLMTMVVRSLKVPDLSHDDAQPHKPTNAAVFGNSVVVNDDTIIHNNKKQLKTDIVNAYEHVNLDDISPQSPNLN